MLRLSAPSCTEINRRRCGALSLPVFPSPSFFRPSEMLYRVAACVALALFATDVAAFSLASPAMLSRASEVSTQSALS